MQIAKKQARTTSKYTIQRVLQNPARFALLRDTVSGDFYWLTSCRCQSWLYIRSIVLQSL